MIALAVGLGGALGAVARYLLDGAVQDRTSGTYPYGTLVVNVSGSFVLGLIAGLVVHADLAPHLRTAVGTGLCGGFTTWSTATWEVVQLAHRGSRRAAVSYAVVGVAASTAAAAVGWWLTAA